MREFDMNNEDDREYLNTMEDAAKEMVARIVEVARSDRNPMTRATTSEFADLLNKGAVDIGLALDAKSSRGIGFTYRSHEGKTVLGLRFPPSFPFNEDQFIDQRRHQVKPTFVRIMGDFIQQYRNLKVKEN